MTTVLKFPHKRRMPVGRPALPDYLTVDEVAERLRVTQATVHKLITKQHIESVKVGSRRRISVKALQTYIRRNTDEVSA